MATTIILDEDVAVLIEQEAQRAGQTPSEAANRLLKGQFKPQPTFNGQPIKPFVVKPVDMNLPPEWTSGSIQGLMDLLDERELKAQAQQ